MEKDNSTKRKSILDTPSQKIPKKSLSSYIKPSKSTDEPISCPFGTRGQLEREVVKECIAWLRSERILCIKLFTGGIFTGKSFAANEASGCPDYITFAFIKKQIIWIEFKRNSGGKISQEQKNWHSYIRACNGIVLVVCSLKHLQYEWSKL